MTYGIRELSLYVRRMFPRVFEAGYDSTFLVYHSSLDFLVPSKLNPYLIRQPSRLEGLSRTVRNYVPTSISIAVPSASPSPPRVSLPVSFGRFMSPTQPSAPLDATGTDRRSWGIEVDAKTLDEVLSLNEHDASQAGAQRSDLPRYPGSDDSEYITWARWDALLPSGGPTM